MNSFFSDPATTGDPAAVSIMHSLLDRRGLGAPSLAAREQFLLKFLSQPSFQTNPRVGEIIDRIVIRGGNDRAVTPLLFLFSTPAISQHPHFSQWKEALNRLPASRAALLNPGAPAPRPSSLFLKIDADCCHTDSADLGGKRA